MRPHLITPCRFVIQHMQMPSNWSQDWQAVVKVARMSCLTINHHPARNCIAKRGIHIYTTLCRCTHRLTWKEISAGISFYTRIDCVFTEILSCLQNTTLLSIHSTDIYLPMMTSCHGRSTRKEKLSAYAKEAFSNSS